MDVTSPSQILIIDNARAVASEVSSIGRRAIGIAVDVSQPEQVKQMVATALAEFGTIDILINCAGVSQHDPAELTPLETWDRVLDINLRGTFLSCQAAAQIMLKNKRGVIVNFSSIAGSVGMGRGANAYCASKGGVDTLTKQLALGMGITRNSCERDRAMSVHDSGSQGSHGGSAIRSESIDGNVDH